MSLYSEIDIKTRQVINEISNEMYHSESSRNIQKGKRVHTLNRNIPLNIVEYDDNIECSGKVPSETSNKNYKIFFNIDKDDKEIIYTACNCMDYENNGYYSDNYMCKHIVAGIFRLFDYLAKENFFDEEKNTELEFLKIFNDDISREEQINLEVIVHIDKNSFASNFDVSLKIGFEKLYLVKNIIEFFNARNTGNELVLGKLLSYSSNDYSFSESDEKVLNFLELAILSLDRMRESLGVRGIRNIGSKGKFLKLDKRSLRPFLECIKDKDFKISIEGTMYEDIKVIKENLPMQINLKESKDNIEVDINKFNSLTLENDVCFYKNSLYIPSYEQRNYLSKLNELTSKKEKIEISKDNLEVLFEKVIPRLKRVGEVKVDKKINDKILMGDFKAEFYLDKHRGNVYIEDKISYGDTLVKDAGDKYIVRDGKKEYELYQNITKLGFRKQDDKYVFCKDDEELFYFIDKGVQSLNKLGDVFYSESFKKFNIVKSPSVSVDIKERQDYLDFSFEVENVEQNDIKKIISAINSGKKFFKLSEDSFIDLSGKELSGFVDLMDNVDNIKVSADDNVYRVNKNRAMYLADYLETKKNSFVKGTKLIDKLSKKFKAMKKMEFELPSGLNATLRDYQIEGFKWFKTLTHFGFAGVLADEMGLGKTIQTITYILSEEGKKTLVVTPTALVYNWKNEFEKFAPSLKIGIAHGTKKQREDILNNIEEYDVILTTYGTIKNDGFYDEYEFDIMIIDEAQNIKNSVAKSAIAVKSVNAKNKFALTGTPIENNLLELWSIFDYAMPGYLFNRNKFTRTFMSGESKYNDLNKAINPFILRREKKQVLKELPDKMEKQFFVELSKEQKKLYSTYVKDLRGKMENSEDKSKVEVFAYLMKLRQLCLEPSIVYKDYKGENSKLDMAMNLVDGYIENGHKILLFSQFTGVLSTIKDTLDKKRIEYSYIDGSVKAKDRLTEVDDFNNSKDKKVFLISLKAGGTGLNLTSADVVIHFDPWWNPAVEDQATDRAHRIGQENKVEVIKLISKGTIEEKIVKLQEDKKDIIEKVMTGNLSNGSILSSLSEKEIINLFEADF